MLVFRFAQLFTYCIGNFLIPYIWNQKLKSHPFIFTLLVSIFEVIFLWIAYSWVIFFNLLCHSLLSVFGSLILNVMLLKYNDISLPFSFCCFFLFYFPPPSYKLLTILNYLTCFSIIFIVIVPGLTEYWHHQFTSLSDMKIILPW